MGYSYGYNRAERIDDYKTRPRVHAGAHATWSAAAATCCWTSGPTGDGTIPVIMEQRLMEIGDWLKVNGEAIYGTRFAGRACQWSEGKTARASSSASIMVKYNLMEQVGQKPNKGGMAVKQVFFTKKPDALYAITPGWPGKQLVLRNVQAPRASVVTMLGVPGPLHCQVEGNTLTIEMPKLNPDTLPCRFAYAFKIAGAKVLPDTGKP